MRSILGDGIFIQGGYIVDENYYYIIFYDFGI
jgi:hypothetical protein